MAIKFGGRSLTASEQKTKVKQWTGWSDREYERQYDRLRLRVRNYERATGQSKGSINVADLLARHERNAYYERVYGAREGSSESTTWKAIQKTTSASTGKPLSQRTTEKIQNTALDALHERFAGIAENSKYSEWIKEELEKLRQSGQYDYTHVQNVYERAARMLDNEKKWTERFNDDMEDPFSRIEWSS